MVNIPTVHHFSVTAQLLDILTLGGGAQDILIKLDSTEVLSKGTPGVKHPEALLLQKE